MILSYLVPRTGSTACRREPPLLLRARVLPIPRVCSTAHTRERPLVAARAGEAAMPIYQRKPREVAKNQMLDNNTSCAIRKIRSGKMNLYRRFGPIFEKNSF